MVHWASCGSISEELLAAPENIQIPGYLLPDLVGAKHAAGSARRNPSSGSTSAAPSSAPEPVTRRVSDRCDRGPSERTGSRLREGENTVGMETRGSASAADSRPV